MSNPGIAQQQTTLVRQTQFNRLMALPQMQQALYLLQLPIQQLRIFVEAQLSQNLLFEPFSQSEDVDKIKDTEIEELDFTKCNSEGLQILDEAFPDSKGEWGDYEPFTNQEASFQTYKAQSIQSGRTLHEHLSHQAKQNFAETESFSAAELLIGYLDNEGYLNVPPQEIAALHHISLELLTQTLKELQTFEPAGVGAATLQESLLIQLQLKSKGDSLAAKLICFHFEDLLQNQFKKISKALNVSISEINEAILRDISSLNFHPGGSYSKEPIITLIPDVTLIDDNGKFYAHVNDEGFPMINFNKSYMNMLRDPYSAPETKEYLYHQLNSIKWLLKNIEQRNENLKKVSLAIAEKQKAFFLDPCGLLVPLNMKILADELHLHESTVARTVSNKYLHSPRGLFPIRTFFSCGYQSDNGNRVSSKTIQNLLREMIEKEDKNNPLSDAALAVLLKEQGIPCARRTIAKYRTEMKLGNARQRRKFT